MLDVLKVLGIAVGYAIFGALALFGTVIVFQLLRHFWPRLSFAKILSQRLDDGPAAVRATILIVQQRHPLEVGPSDGF